MTQKTIKLQIKNSVIVIPRDQLKTENLKINIELTSSKDIVEIVASDKQRKS